MLVATLDGRFAELFLAQTQRGPFERTHSGRVGFVFRGEVRTCSSPRGTDRRTLSPLFDENFNFVCPVLMAGWGGREVEEEGRDRARAKGSAFFLFFCAWDSPRVDGEGMGCFIVIIIFKSRNPALSSSCA